MQSPADITEYWIGTRCPEIEDGRAKNALWWAKNPEMDREIDARFGGSVHAARGGALDHWASENPSSALALVLLFDQLPRNIFRGSAESFATDKRAVEVARAGLDVGFPDRLGFYGRYFWNMPLMHSEDLADQNLCVTLFDELARGREEEHRKVAEAAADYAREHRDIVGRWGRFPHRNEWLGRESTPAELRFLREPGSSF